MAISGEERHASAGGDTGGGKLWNLCRMPFRQAGGAPAPAPPQSSSSGIHHSAGRYGHEAPVAGDGGAQGASAGSISSVAKSLLPARRRLRLDPANKLYFPYEPGKQVKSAIRIKNTSKSHVAFKFDEQKDQAVVEKILKVVFLDINGQSPQLEKLNNQIAEAEAALEARKKPPEENGPKIVGEGLVIDEWKERRERYLAQQQVEVVDSV
ncbi:hypothetical protein BAE44_0003568 [Dichanthelium oligosanthes]|uniref:MSP domain-containing protein n=1 Tax=Dichanthelium oligosanthes TaxID=888268 RepID=A0A1E5WDC0_9POAL|nr:hypothetical protein BAE44_0003568 [Dichanthelium oligosanthes]